MQSTNVSFAGKGVPTRWTGTKVAGCRTLEFGDVEQVDTDEEAEFFSVYIKNAEDDLLVWVADLPEREDAEGLERLLEQVYKAGR